jgi:hypothetical protein
LAKGHVLCHKARLPSGLRGHADSLLALVKAALNGLTCLAKLRLRALKLPGRLAKQGLRSAEVRRACAQRQSLRFTQPANALRDGGRCRLQIGLAGGSGRPSGARRLAHPD